MPSPAIPNADTLNKEQQKAIQSANSRLLVLAGAGAGKTRILIEKIKYLVFQKGVPPSRILAITFTRNAADEMLDRLIAHTDTTDTYKEKLEQASYPQKLELRRQWKQKFNWIQQLHVSTFHGFCFGLLRKEGVKEFDSRFRLLTDESAYNGREDFTVQLKPEDVIRQQLLQHAASDIDYLLQLKWYLVDYYGQQILNKAKKQFPKTPPDQLLPYTSINGTAVRSKSEMYVADWLYRHGIIFIYESRVNMPPHGFKPDFYIPAADMYIEHISSYSSGTQVKKESLRYAKRSVGYVYEEDFIDSRRYSVSLDALLRNRLSHCISQDQAVRMEEVLQAYTPYIDDLTKLMKRVIDLIKVEATDFENLYLKTQQDPHERVSVFYALLKPVWHGFADYCSKKSLLDFNDLIQKAVATLQNHKDVRYRYSNQFDYILVDEFQDVNNLQVLLLRQLLKTKTQLFCVGDDWQSVYSFRGAVVDYIIRFENYFKGSKTITLSYNYRSTHTIVEAGNNVIAHNKFKIEKNIKAFNKTASRITVFVAQKEQEDGVEYVVSKIVELQKNGFATEDILILSRRHAQALPYNTELRKRGIDLYSKTIHASKGLEARAVFIVGLREGSGGFPDLWMNDRIFQLIRPQDVQLMMEEERRLFYVAITRAREMLFLITEAGCESSFIKEIPESFLSREQVNIVTKPSFYTCAACGHLSYQKVNFCAGCGAAM
ncbi:MAG: ATP-dependent helicase [Chitinophagaceae bacterium]